MAKDFSNYRITTVNDLDKVFELISPEEIYLTMLKIKEEKKQQELNSEIVQILVKDDKQFEDNPFVIEDSFSN